MIALLRKHDQLISHVPLTNIHSIPYFTFRSVHTIISCLETCFQAKIAHLQTDRPTLYKQTYMPAWQQWFFFHWNQAYPCFCPPPPSRKEKSETKTGYRFLVSKKYFITFTFWGFGKPLTSTKNNKSINQIWEVSIISILRYHGYKAISKVFAC